MKKVVFASPRAERKIVGYRAPDGTGYAYSFNGTFWMIGADLSPRKIEEEYLKGWEPIREGDTLSITF